MHLGGKYKISWSNDDLERFYKSGHFEPPPGNLSRPRGPGQIGLKNIQNHTRYMSTLVCAGPNSAIKNPTKESISTKKLSVSDSVTL